MFAIFDHEAEANEPRGCSTCHQQNSVMYDCKCHYDTVRRANISTTTVSHQAACSQWLKQQLTRPHRPQPHRSCKQNDTKPDCNSIIGQHLLENKQCALNYDNKQFSILAIARSSFHLNLLEVVHIIT